MADNLPVNFPIPGETSLPTYNWTDLESGVGFATFYGMAGTNESGAVDLLTEQAGVRSEVIEDTGTGDNFTVSANFQSSPFNSPRRVKGVAQVSFSSEFDGNHASDNYRVTVTVYKYSPGATQIGQVVKDFGNGDRTENHMFFITLTQTDFKIGDYISVFVQCSQTVNTGTSGKIISFGKDPANRDGTYITPTSEDATTVFRADIPFRINI